MHLHGVGNLPGERAGEDRRPHHEVVGERQLRLYARRDLAHGLHVCLHIGEQLGVAAVGERARFDALVAVGDVNGQQGADVGAVDRTAHRIAHRPHAQAPAFPVAGGVDEGVRLGVALLAEQVHLVSERHQRRSEACVVDV